ncbi:xanthine dehydrogenase small subunit [Paenarthrobacter sp. NPDC091711]|uniref:xanthine dehydrogenase small subunit n=1 Tax=Paenarthrobacter sp. NPDC091711 TaxID=3364385 RepID=UPI0038224C4E
MTGSYIRVNGESRSCERVGPHTRLLDWLRSEGLTGAKEGCAEGECGACAVMVARPDGPDRTRWTAVNACLPPALAFDGQEVVTAEGLGAAKGPIAGSSLHPVQQEMAARGGSQCGYCTPGFICSMAAEFYRPGRTAVPDTDSGVLQDNEETHPGHECGPNGFDLHALSGNLCRCTGYRPIRDAAYALEQPDESDPLHRRQNHPAPRFLPTNVSDGTARFIRPSTLDELLALLSQNPDASLSAGSTDIGVEVNLRHSRSAWTVAIDRLEPLRVLHIGADCLEIGSALTLTEIEHGLDGQVPLLAQLFPQFASRLIRNAATLGGNLGTGSPIGDSAPALLALNASVVLASLNGERQVPLADYFTGYRQSVRRPGELLRSVRIPLPLAEHAAFYKIAKRRFDDISSVSVAIAMRMEEGRISSIRVGIGGVAATPLRATKTEAALHGKPWNLEVIQAAAGILAGEGTPIDDLRATAAYRSAMLGNSLLRFFSQTNATLAGVTR